MGCIARWVLAFPLPDAMRLIVQIKCSVNVTVNVYGIVYIKKYTDRMGPCQVEKQGIFEFVTNP
jgi:hypothetical protein